MEEAAETAINNDNKWSVLSKLTIKVGKMVGRRHYNILLLSSCIYKTFCTSTQNHLL